MGASSLDIGTRTGLHEKRRLDSVHSNFSKGSLE
jgi:hypothetical protein